MVENDVFVTPGEKIATEEEFAAGHNTFVEERIDLLTSNRQGREDRRFNRCSCSGREIKIIGQGHANSYRTL
jgi:exosome complex RNA-binding protein Csl4